MTHPTEWLVDLEITRRCNAHCAACFVKAQPHADAELPTPIALDVLQQLHGQPAVIHLTGGEPFLHPGVWTILARVAELGFRRLVVNTNATLLDEAALTRLAGLGLQTTLLVSMDGPPGTHARSRGVAVAEAACRVLSTGPRVGLDVEPATILTRELLAYGLPRWHRWLGTTLARGVALVLFPLFVPPGKRLSPESVGTPLWPSDLHDAATQVAELFEHGERIGVIDYPLINPLLRARGVPEEALHQCMAGRGRFCVQADGTISPCHPLQAPLFRAGPKLLARLVRHLDYRRIGLRSFPSCQGCAHLAICGHCRAAIVGRGGTLLGADEWCQDLGARSIEPASWPVPSRLEKHQPRELR